MYSGLAPGARATLHRLKNKPELNARDVIVKQWDDDRRRWEVTPVDGSVDFPRAIWVKPHNLTAVAAAGATGIESLPPAKRARAEAAAKQQALANERDNAVASSAAWMSAGAALAAALGLPPEEGTIEPAIDL